MGELYWPAAGRYLRTAHAQSHLINSFQHPQRLEQYSSLPTLPIPSTGALVISVMCLQYDLAGLASGSGGKEHSPESYSPQGRIKEKRSQL